MVSFEKLREMRRQTVDPQVRRMNIEMLEPTQEITHSGHPVDYLEWRYRLTEFEDQKWRYRRTCIASDEARVVLDNGPYESDCEYEVTARRAKSGFRLWIDIQKVQCEIEEAA